jgi:hypothetical protein
VSESLTPERRAELRRHLAAWRVDPRGPNAVRTVELSAVQSLPALLDIADEADRLRAANAELAAALEVCRDAMDYAGFFGQYPFTRALRLLRDESAKAVNQDDQNYWRFATEKLLAAAAALAKHKEQP